MNEQVLNSSMYIVIITHISIQYMSQIMKLKDKILILCYFYFVYSLYFIIYFFEGEGTHKCCQRPRCPSVSAYPFHISF